MHVITRRALREFWERHPDSEDSLRAWYDSFKKTSYRDFEEIKQRFPFAKSAGDGRYIFRIKGNDYRLIVRINFPGQVVFVRFVGTHAEYDKVDARTV